MTVAYPIAAMTGIHATHSGNSTDYCGWTNYVEAPTMTIPVTEVIDSDLTEEYTDKFNDPVTAAINDDMKGTLGLPLGVVFVGKHHEDEKLLGFGKQMDEFINFRKTLPAKFNVPKRS